MPGPRSVTRTSCAAASAASRLPAIGVPAALVSRNVTVIAWADLASVAPGFGAANPPKPYTTSYTTRTGAGWTFPATSAASAQVAANGPTPSVPVVVTFSDAGLATPERLSVVRQAGAGTWPRT